ncbi:MAG: bifunctional aspartate kinase/homoserine dehydrogenase I [Acidobacteriota bacterium]
MKVLKFGGTSVATADSIRRVTGIISDARANGPIVVVVSALGGVTNGLIEAAEAASRHGDSYLEPWQSLRQRHLETIQELALPAAETLSTRVNNLFDDLRDLLHGVYLLRESSPRTLDGILSYGERLAAAIVATSLNNEGIVATDCDAREMIVTDDTFGNAGVDTEVSNDKIRRRIHHERQSGHVPVVTGFIAATHDGRTTTLGRGGSDYTAALLGAALDAQAIELWTDVDGVMSADPRLVDAAFPQPQLSYAELMELSHFGAKVVYAPSIHPARSRGIPLVIKNTFNPQTLGTRVSDEPATGTHPIRGISAINRVALMRLEGDGMVGVPGIAMRLFAALARRGVSVILISQSSSEHSICFAVAPGDADAASEAVHHEFRLERRAGIVDELIVERGQSIIAAVGEQMRRRPGLAGNLFEVLGIHGVNVRAIAQGSSELNISLVIDQSDEVTALNAMHGAFFKPRLRRAVLAIIGTGRVGSALLEQLRDARDKLAEREYLDIRVVALAGSRRMVLDADGVDLEGWRGRLEGEAEALDRERLSDLLLADRDAQRILIDCTASDDLATWYGQLLEAGCSVVAANKKPFAGPFRVFQALHEAADRGRASLYHEATVGAGLPVLSTLTDLNLTGDRVERVDGVLSGTVNAVLDRLAGGESFSQAVRGAHADGLTEPNPWEDLSGGDVARKLCILSRLTGGEIELDDIDVEPVLAGDDWSTMDIEAFWDALPRVDEAFGQRLREANEAGCRLRYVASFDSDGARVALQAVPPEHPAHSLKGADNLVAFTTERYRDSPLVLRGPGAGPAVTAGGVFADILRAIDRRRR